MWKELFVFKLRYVVVMVFGFSLLLSPQSHAYSLNSSDGNAKVAEFSSSPSGISFSKKSCKKKGRVVVQGDVKLVCTKKPKGLKWVKVPINTGFSEPDLVTAKIESMLHTISPPNYSAEVSPMSFLVEDSRDEVFVPGLILQFTHLAQAYPEFSWDNQGFTLMPRTEQWLIEKMKSLKCPDNIIEYARKGVSRGHFIWGMGASTCDPELGPVAIIGRTAPPEANIGHFWDNIVASEFSEIIRRNNFAKNTLPPLVGNVPMSYFDVNMPSWMREGSEFGFFSISQFKQTQRWYFHAVYPSSRCGTGILRDYASFTSENSGCHYLLGQFAIELMIALYGFDAPSRWFSSFGSQTDPYVAFEAAYGDDYNVFEGFVSEFINYRIDGTPLSPALKSRLS